MNGAQAVLESLKEEGVELVFGYPGGAVLTLYDAIYKLKFPHILTRHEQGAVHAADGYARATGKVGVVIATSGPGATNLITGIATASMDSVPLVCITGQVANPYIGKDSFQESDVCGITTPITKHNYLVKNPEDIPRIVKEAFFIARTGRPGPVVIDVAKDVFDATIDYRSSEEVALRGYSGDFSGCEEEIDAVIDALKAAEKPLIFVGGGVNLSDTSQEMREIAEILGAPSVSTMMGIGCIAAGTDGYLGFAGMHGAYAANMSIQCADFLLAFGTRFSDRVTGKMSEFAELAKIAHFDVDRAEINKNIPADYPVIADLRWSLPRFIEKLKGAGVDWRARSAAWRAETAEFSKEYPFSYRKHDEVIMPGALIEKISEVLPEDAIVVTDVGQHQMWAAQFYAARHPRQFLTSGGLGTMGYGLPAAIGAKLAFPERTVVLITGDGSIMMNCQEFATLADNDIDVKVVVVHNSILGMVGQWQRLFYARHYSHSLLEGKTDFPKLAEAMGVRGYRLERAAELDERLGEILNSDGAALLDCIVPKEEDVLPMVPGGKRLDQMVLGKR